MELRKVDPGYYMIKYCRPVSMRCKCSSVYRMSESQKKRRKVLRHSKKKDKIKTLKLREPHMKGEPFKTQY